MNIVMANGKGFENCFHVLLLGRVKVAHLLEEELGEAVNTMPTSPLSPGQRSLGLHLPDVSHHSPYSNTDEEHQDEHQDYEKIVRRPLGPHFGVRPCTDQENGDDHGAQQQVDLVVERKVVQASPQTQRQ